MAYTRDVGTKRLGDACEQERLFQRYIQDERNVMWIAVCVKTPNDGTVYLHETMNEHDGIVPFFMELTAPEADALYVAGSICMRHNHLVKIEDGQFSVCEKCSSAGDNANRFPLKIANKALYKDNDGSWALDDISMLKDFGTLFRDGNGSNYAEVHISMCGCHSVDSVTQRQIPPHNKKKRM